jgi:hypothetical protein
MFLDDLTKEGYMELWKEHGSDVKICAILHTSNTPLQVWKKENNVKTMDIIKARRIKVWEERVKLNNELKEQGLDSHSICGALGFGAIQSYWGWRNTAKQKGYEIL